jgi:hypothetical protein
VGVVSRALNAFHKLLPWGGIVAGGLGAGLFHQIGSDSVFNDCRYSTPIPVVLLGLMALLLIAAGAAGSWSVWRGKDEGSARRLVAVVSLMVAALLTFFVLLTVLAALIIPPCHA